MAEIKLEASWQSYLAAEFSKPYMQQLKQFLQHEKSQNKTIYPKGSEIFNAFNYTPIDKVKVVILGQDPYHGPNQAHGLSFSVKLGIKPPPSLLNIYKELKDDLGLPMPNHGYLACWAEQGVLLLNSVLTVERANAASHQGRGWEIFTDKVIEILNQRVNPMIFVLWGNYAHKKGQTIDTKKHLVLQAAHPSPFAAHKGFFGCKHFSKINKQLEAWGLTPIDWGCINNIQ